MHALEPNETRAIDEYFANELKSRVPHEFVDTKPYAMKPESNVHALLRVNVMAALSKRINRAEFELLGFGHRIRINRGDEWRVYYPDAAIFRHPTAPNSLYQEAPVVVVEVMSKPTRRFDYCEKCDAYLTIPTLAVYLLVEDRFPGVLVFRRQGAEFIREPHETLSAVIPLPEIGAELPLADIYEGMDFSTVADDDDIDDDS